MPSFGLNRTVVEQAERFGFALSMIKLRGYGGPSGCWDRNLGPFTPVAGLAAVTRVTRLMTENARTGRNCGALVLIMVIADETDAAGRPETTP